MLEKSNKIYIAGHRGLVGSALLRVCEKEGYSNVLTAISKELDLRDQAATLAFFEAHHPDIVMLAAAKVGGIWANQSYPAEFLYDNLMIEANVLHAAWQTGVKKLLFLGSSCIYPKHAELPIREDALLSGPLEQTNYAYAMAKISGIMLCKAYNQQYGTQFTPVMPCNLYGPNDNYDLENSHVLPALIRKFHEAKQSGAPSVTIWGSGQPRREFLHADDLAAACLHLLQQSDSTDLINIGTGEDISILELAQLIQRVVGFEGALVFDRSKPDGVMRKVMDVSQMRRLGFEPQISLEDGLRQTYAAYCDGLMVKV